MNSLKLRDHWVELCKQKPCGPGGGYRLQFIRSQQGVRVYAAVTDPDLYPAVVVELAKKLKRDRIASVSGRVVEIKVAEFPGLSPGRYGVVLELRDHDYEDLFERLGEDIVSTINNSTAGVGAEAAITRCIERWRTFIERSRQPMSDEEVRGLLGELTVLARCLERFSEATSIGAWVGPLGALRDFCLPEASVEVKTFQSDTGASVRFNDPQQLDSDGLRPVYVAAVPLARHATRGVTLADAVAHIRGRLTPCSECAQSFEELLIRYGYSDAFAARLDQRYLVGPLILYRVEDSFPRIRSADVPPGVEHVHFSVALAGLRPFIADAEGVLGVCNPALENEEQ